MTLTWKHIAAAIAVVAVAVIASVLLTRHLVEKRVRAEYDAKPPKHVIIRDTTTLPASTTIEYRTRTVTDTSRLWAMAAEINRLRTQLHAVLADAEPDLRLVARAEETVPMRITVWGDSLISEYHVLNQLGLRYEYPPSDKFVITQSTEPIAIRLPRAAAPDPTTWEQIWDGFKTGSAVMVIGGIVAGIAYITFSAL